MHPDAAFGVHPFMPRGTTPKTGHPRRWKRVLAVLLLIVAATGVDYFYYPYGNFSGGRSFNRGRNALWIHYSYYFGEHSVHDELALAQRCRDAQIAYAYCHVRFITKKGQLRYRHPAAARRLVTNLHRAAPGLKAIAWIYVGNERGITGVDLSDNAVRAQMVREAAWLMRECGFDGIQWDYEICPSGDTDFLKLLRESRAALPRTWQGVATAMWMPRIARNWNWTDDYFEKVAAQCDQMAVMAYDSGMYSPRAYVWLMRQQAIHITRAAARANPTCRVQIGVPTYEDPTPSHHPHAENLRLALKGVREGLANHNAVPAAFEGIAIFADHTTTPTEWRQFKDQWPKSP